MRTYAKAIACMMLILFLFTPLSNGIILDDPTPPVTDIFIDYETGYISFSAVVYPIHPDLWIVATYYSLDGSEYQVYTEHFEVDEGTHNIMFWSIDNRGFEETRKSATFTIDISPPTIEFYYPEPGLYLLGNKLLSLNNTVFCIGKVPIEVDAQDNISGVKRVFFNIGNDSGYDNSEPYDYTYRGNSFGELTISAYAEDNYGRISETIELTIQCYSLGIL
jgi:hypothetical protein